MRKKLLVALLAGAGSVAIGGTSARAAAAAAEAGTPVSEVVVTAPRQEIQARVVQKAAINLISVRSVETILKYPDFNAAEALGRMPGVSLSADTGEGRFVQIRGIDANLDGATYGGIPLLNTYPGGTESGGGGRAVEFDTIPTGAVDGIIVTYTLLPDHEAEGLGGSIELTPRTAVNIQKPFFDVSLGWGYEPLHKHTGPFEADVAVGARFGFGSHGLAVQGVNDANAVAPGGFFTNPTPFSFVLYASTKQDRRAIDDLEESYVDDGVAPSNAVSRYDLRYYNYHRRRFSFGGDFEFTPNDDHRWYVRANVAGYTEAVHKNFLLFTGLDAVENTSGVGPVIPVDPADPNGYLVTTSPNITLTDEEEVHRNTIIAVGGVDRWNDVILDWHAAYSRATFHVRRSIGADFVGPTVNFTYDNVSRPNFPIFGFPDGTNVNDPSIYFLPAGLGAGGISNAQDYDVDEEWSGAANLIFPLRIFNDSDRIKAGFEIRRRDKSAIEDDETYLILDPNLSLVGRSGPATTYYQGHYPTGPLIDMYTVRALINSPLPLDPTQQNGFNFGSYIAATEDIYAGYIQYTTTVGPWSFLAGVRVEDTRADYGGYVQTTEADGSVVNSLLFRPVSYINAFPTVQVRYAFTPTMYLRATWSTGIGRPGFNQNTTAASVDRTASPLLITRGNPDLKPTTGNNFDLAFEDYFANGGILSVALFDKEFRNYIGERIQNGVTTDPLAPGELANVTTFLNIPSAYARGVQVDVHQQAVWLPRPWNGFGIEANLTLVDSRFLEYDAATSASGQNQYGLLPGTSKLTWNLAAFYEAYGLEARIAAEYVSHSLFGLGGDKSLDTIQDNRLTLDFGSSYRINRNFTVYFNAKNLLNTPLRYYEGSPNRPIQREIYDVTYEGGIRASF
jgi:TonB-dependent receptor